MISKRRAEGCMGAEVSGIDLSAPLSDPMLGEVREALRRHMSWCLGRRRYPRTLFRITTKEAQQLLV